MASPEAAGNQVWVQYPILESAESVQRESRCKPAVKYHYLHRRFTH